MTRTDGGGYHLAIGNEQQGPYTEAQAREIAASFEGELRVWTEGWTEWRPASDVWPELGATPSPPVVIPRAIPLPAATATADGTTARSRRTLVAVVGACVVGAVVLWGVILSAVVDSDESTPPVSDGVEPDAAAKTKAAQAVAPGRDLPCEIRTYEPDEGGGLPTTHIYTYVLGHDAHERVVRATQRSDPAFVQKVNALLAKAGMRYIENEFKYVYDADGRLREVERNRGGEKAIVLRLQYDASGRLTQTVTGGTKPGFGGDMTSKVTSHDALGRPERTDISFSELAFRSADRYVNGASGKRFWERNGIVPTPDGDLVWGQTEVYHVDQIRNSERLSKRFSYDAGSGRLTRVETFTPTGGLSGVDELHYGAACGGDRGQAPVVPQPRADSELGEVFDLGRTKCVPTSESDCGGCKDRHCVECREAGGRWYGPMSGANFFRTPWGRRLWRLGTYHAEVEVFGERRLEVWCPDTACPCEGLPKEVPADLGAPLEPGAGAAALERSRGLPRPGAAAQAAPEANEVEVPVPPPPEPEPTAPGSAEPVSTTTSSTTWHCLCYQRRSPTGEIIPVTACRPTASACQALEAHAAKGTKSIVAGSVTHRCRAVVGDHPADALGSREAWSPSSKSGGWVHSTQCLLGSPGEVPGLP